MARGNAVYICGPGDEPGPRADCPNNLHDAPLPADYMGASEEAHNRLKEGWKQKRCSDCGLYGWVTP